MERHNERHIADKNRNLKTAQTALVTAEDFGAFLARPFDVFADALNGLAANKESRQYE
jgi:hypothetical protein